MKGHRMFLGNGAQLAVMSELTSRGYMVSVPSVDIGDDILAARANGPIAFRVQVRGRAPTRCRRKKSQYACFTVSAKQLQTPQEPELYYVFAIRLGAAWDTVIISRPELLALFQENNRKMSHPSRLSLAFSFSHDRVLGLSRNLQSHRNNWSRYWPDLVLPVTAVRRPSG